jgi:hypothetical protein
MQIQSTTKIEEGRYQIVSKPCPDCNTVVTLEIDGSSLYRANQGASVQEVLPNQTADVRERFVSGYCSDCWKLIFADDDEE